MRRERDDRDAGSVLRPRTIDPRSIPPADLQRLLQSLASLPTIEKRLTDIEKDLAFRSGEDPGGGNPTGPIDDEAREQRDPAWQCESCGKVLARYNPVAGELRIKNRGAMVYVVAGVNGKVVIVCPSCGAVNTADSDGKDPATPPG